MCHDAIDALTILLFPPVFVSVVKERLNVAEVGMELTASRARGAHLDSYAGEDALLGPMR